MELKDEQVVVAVAEEKDLREATTVIAIADEKGPNEEAAVTPAASSFSELFSFADAEDVILVRLAFIMSALSGMNQPAQLIIFGSILNSFGVTSNTTSRDEQIKQVSFLAIMYAVVGAQQLLTNWSQTACMTAAAGRQVKRIRERFLEALLRQPVGFYDQNDQGVLSASVMTDTSLVEEGLGEKLALAFQFSMAFIAGIAVALYYNYQLNMASCLMSSTGALLMGGLAHVGGDCDKRPAYEDDGYDEVDDFGPGPGHFYDDGGDDDDDGYFAGAAEVDDDNGCASRWERAVLLGGREGCAAR
jgi:ATP-binding cassette subfamily B (MDR/TAP) protein 1